MSTLKNMRLVEDGPLRSHLKELLELLPSCREELGSPQGLMLSLRIVCESTTFFAFASDPDELSFLAFRDDAASGIPAEEPPRVYALGLDGDVLTVADPLDVMAAARSGPESVLRTEVVMRIRLEGRVISTDVDPEISTDCRAPIDSLRDQLRSTPATDWRLAEVGAGKGSMASAALLALDDYFRRGGKPS